MKFKILYLIFVIILFSPTVYAATFTVCAAGCDYTTIQSAINGVASGNTIYVHDGVYIEQIKVTKSLILEGESNTGTQVVGGFKVTVDGTTIKNFNISRGFEYQRKYYNYDKAGIYVSSSGNTITSNNISHIVGGTYGTASGIYLISSNSNNITSNNISVMTGGTGCIKTTSASAGIYLTSSNFNNITSNNMSAVTDCTSSGIFIVSSIGNVLEGQEIAYIHGYYMSQPTNGIYIASSSENEIISNTIMEISAYGVVIAGVHITSSTKNILTSNNISGAPYGVYLTSSTMNNLDVNNIFGTGYGIYIVSSSIGNIFELNTMYSLSSTAVALDESSYNNTITHLSGNSPDFSKFNTIEGKPILYFYNKTGIEVSNFSINISTVPISMIGKIATCIAFVDVHNSTIRNNTISGFIGSTSSGIFLSSSTRNTLELNKIHTLTGGYSLWGSGGTIAGIYIFSSTGNKIKSNTMSDLVGFSSNFKYGGAAKGIYIASSNVSEITSNTIANVIGGNTAYKRGGAGVGIQLVSSSTKNVLELNTISNVRGGSGGYDEPGGVGVGIYILSASMRNKIELNTISSIRGGSGKSGNPNGVGAGMYLDSSNISEIISNKISDATNGFYISSIYNSSIYNNLVNASNGVLFAGVAYENNWNTTQQTGTRIYSPGSDIGGNYWTNSTGDRYSDICDDLDIDGFCDEAYNLSVGIYEAYDYLALSPDAIPTTSNDISDCTNLNEEGKTYYLTADIIDSTDWVCMNISANNVILDCQGHTIDGNNIAPHGIAIERDSSETTNNTIRNCTLSDWSDAGLYLSYSNGNNITNITANSNKDSGIRLRMSSNNNIFTNIIANNNERTGVSIHSSSGNIMSFVEANNNDEEGISLIASSNNTITNSIFQENGESDFYIDVVSDSSMCNNKIENIMGSNNLPIKYYNDSVSLSNEELSELILCNADNSNITNVTINASQSEKNNGLYVLKTEDSNFKNIVSSDNYIGLHYEYSSNNNISNIIANANRRQGFFASQSFNNNTLTNMLLNNNYIGMEFYSSS
ncbi:MAG: right-handed parallel beta-helix repeat-containing protein, partial [Candidatus Aenigmarchaeota archaeon]|nr:right-handed parallel beta-helix repeat-containing protein [Candidatus Aenigmarchaeota archaeon]